MTARRRRTRAWLLAVAALVACGPEPPPPAAGEPLAGLGDGEVGRFLLGRAVFERLATEEEGLGPLYNATRCSACHEVPATGGGSAIRVVKATRWEDGRCDLLRERGGDNLQQSATPLLRAHGLGPETVPDEANARALVLAPTLFGLGLVEAIPSAALEALADPDDADGDGISGRMGRTEDGRPGRFGRKGEAATIRDFVDMALRFELGFTTPEHPFEEAVNGVPVPPGADPMGEPEIDERGMGLLVDYLRGLAPPPRAWPEGRPARDSVQAGARLFETVGCAACHVPELQTGPHPTPALDRRRVPLHSDLLLHDLGPALAGVCGPGASPTEHRTSRLWGLASRDAFLHDGRASTLVEAIEWHGGEAAASRVRFRALPAADARRLLLYLGSL